MIAQIRSAADLGDFIRRIRLQHGMTQEQLAAALGTTQRYVSELEAGRPKRADERYFEILARLGIALTAESTSPGDHD
ncbi:XRE family transcriptional regulator [Cryobacterium sp. Sr8]|uniref:helix-turn-helix domain-containing protein n=1 Tax=Cryobacterium sp. Sr8 TaxID=1259203 RepID=UPI00106AC4F9|nr:helix-turn-helix transcriptional regulator [Cryobacterium sp. Sr8]TFD76104.1 XRE family transcriptional regulator [Cryobacterium sp. Sr8]